jgi:DNA-binding FadR family transcriptional regulator
VPDARDMLKHGRSLDQKRFRTFPEIASLCGFAESAVRRALQAMEQRGEVEVRQGHGKTHGNTKSYRAKG